MSFVKKSVVSATHRTGNPVLPRPLDILVAAHSNPAELKRLIEGKADVNELRCGFAPLHFAFATGSVELLLKAKAIVDIRGDCGITPTAVCATLDEVRTLELLCDAGADLNLPVPTSASNADRLISRMLREIAPREH